MALAIARAILGPKKLRDVQPGSLDPDLDFLSFPNPGVKKALDPGVKKAPDPGSATLVDSNSKSCRSGSF
jgi:hypothetical protein